MKVLLRAPLLTNSGYGVHSRQIFEWIYGKDDIDLTTECLNWGHTPWLINPDTNKGLTGKIMECSKSLIKDKYDLTIQVQLPDEWNSNLGKKNIGVSAFVETDRCNPAWIECCNKMDHVIVPSRFTKTLTKRSGVITTPITVVPEWYNHTLLNKSKMTKIISNDNRYNFDTKFNILMIGQFTSTNTDDDRKNLANALKWTIETFKGNEEVGIVVKVNFGRGTTKDQMMTKAGITQIISESRNNSEFPKIHLIHGNMTSDEIASLYTCSKIKMYASATRGEGYGLPLIDAAASGLPIVVTGWSGHFEFLDKNLVRTVDYNLKEINKSRVDGRIFLDGFRWAEPLKSSFCRNMKFVYENYSEMKANANILKKSVISDYHKSKIKKLYDKIFDEV